jgi:hypothetical protein
VSTGMRKKFEKDLNYIMKLFRITQEGWKRTLTIVLKESI